MRKGQVIERGSLTGQIVELPQHPREEARWLRAQFDGDTETRYFSQRGDGVWREFPGAADAEGLVFHDLDYSVSLPKPRHNKRCEHGRLIRADVDGCTCGDSIDALLDLLEVRV